MFSEEEITEFHDNLLGWFEGFARDFPWRRTSNPFHILLAEKLLQQTVARQIVIDAYSVVVARYSEPTTLANAEISDLEEIVRPLGFLYRAKELKNLGRELVIRHEGVVPATLNELLALPGIGDYAARAVLSFTFGNDVAIVDTNVARFLHRIFGIEDPMPANPARKKSLINLATQLLPAGKARDYNLAVLDLCALVCKPKQPKCQVCSVQKCCVFGSKR